MNNLVTTRSNLRLVGRSRELEELDAIPRTESVWIWGPPGVGKSRLATEWLLREEASAIALDLSTCTSEAELLVRIADSLSVQGEPNEQLRGYRARLQSAVRESGRLLFLDNADRVREAVEEFLSDGTIGAVVTCRSAPANASHRRLQLGPLTDDAALELFTTAALRANPDLVLEQRPVARLLQRLDGLPLAIEFAARRTRVLAVPELARRLETGGGSTMDGVLQWTWNELDDEHRNALVQCCVFTDSFTIEAAEAVIEPGRAAVLDILDSLVTMSWLQRLQGADGSYRFRLLHTMRDFALGRASAEALAPAGERAAAYWTEVSTRLRHEIEGPHGEQALRRLEAERENILGVVDAALQRRDPRALVLVENLRWNAAFVGPAFRYAEVVEAARQLVPHAPQAVAARFLEFSAGFARATGRPAVAADDAQRAVELAAATGDAALRSRASTTLGAVLAGTDPDRALAQLQDGANAADAAGVPFERARALERHGFVHLQRFELEDAETCFRTAIDLYRRHASDLFVNDSLCGLGWVLFRRGRTRAASSRFAAALEEADRLGIPVRIAACAYNLAVAEHAAGELREAANHIDAALRHWSRLGLDGYLPAGWVASARIYWDLEQPERAIRAARTAERLAPAVGDLHNQGLAAGLTAMFSWGNDGVPMDDDLFDTLSALDVGADPVAATAHLVGLVGMRAARGIPSLRELNRAEEIAALVPEEDEHVYGVLTRLLTVARAFSHVSDARHAGAATERSLAAGLARRELDHLGLPADPRSLRRVEPDFYVRLLLGKAYQELDRLDAPEVELPPEFRHDVEFHANCHWVRIDGGEPIDLSSRKQLRLIVKALAKQHFANPTVLVSVEELLELAWPGEVMTTSSGRSRIYTAIRDLRKMGLDAIIVTEEGGYRLASDVRFRVAPHTGILPP